MGFAYLLLSQCPFSNTFKSGDIIKKPEHAILVLWWYQTAYDVTITSKWHQYNSNSYVILQVKPLNKSFNLNREILSKLWLKSQKTGSILL